MQKKISGSFEEIKITKHFNSNKQKYRLCYIPKQKGNILKLQINYDIELLIPIVNKIILKTACQKMRIYVRSDFYDPGKAKKLYRMLSETGVRYEKADFDPPCNDPERVFLCTIVKS